ncbi:hypothetical protein QWY93_18415 [Echinicola jeungdonensis]|uniref:hypothetical protein n=1 Tax=Echinicola jeungdonensis TaxID=709343 RepID=UPI0025B4485F|nr:hypothetical protein [Echinicola jeungdonensis]MDN3671277.1 hypothetical protein [Echinicola jeungdonensis]
MWTKKSKIKINEIKIAGNENFADAKVKKKMKKTNEHAVFIFQGFIYRLFEADAEDVSKAISQTNPVTDRR